MHPIDFEGSNRTFGPPIDMSQEECCSCRAYEGIDDAGYPFVMVALQPNKEDVEAIKAGRPIFVRFIGQGLRPFSAWTFNENNEPNV